MSEQTEALNFGPQWIRDLSNGANVSVPPPSPGPCYKLAQFRYGKEEMLALFSKDFKPPNINQDVADFILNEDVRHPLALMPLTEEEQRNSFGSLNSMAVLKMMGRGGQRGGRGMSRGGRGAGRGQPGFYRGFSQDDSSKPDEGWQRDRKTSWGDNAGRGGFGDRTSARDTETSPRGYDPNASSGRHGRALASGNWRSSESGDGDDDGGGWITTGPRGNERADRWRGSSRDSWHREDHSKENWNKSWNRNSYDDVPEWSKPDNVFEPDSGSFDDTGVFCTTKDKKPAPDDSKDSQEKHVKEDWELELQDNNDDSKCDDLTKETDYIQNKAKNSTTENNVELQDCSASNTKDTQEHVKEEDTTEEKSAEIKHVLTDEVGANLERVAESCIANLDVESEEGNEERQSSSLERSISEETKWFYRDPQGLEQGPFSCEEMIEWFHHGYFTMQLSVRRHCDAAYLSLGDLIKRWKRVPFMPGPSPPPITHQQVISEQTMFMQQQLLQQHYQHLQKQAILQKIQQQQHIQQEQRQQAVESSLKLNFTSSESRSLRTNVVSPRSLPTTTHSGSPVGAAEMIWGPDPQSLKNSWSSTGKGSSWNEPRKQTSPNHSMEEIQRREREKEIEKEQERERLEAERKEAELVALKQREEEEKREFAKRKEEQRRLAELALKQKEEEEKTEQAKRQEEERRRLEHEAREKAEAEKRKQKEKKRKAAEDQKLLEKQRLADELLRKGNVLKQRQAEQLMKQEAEKMRREEQRKELERKKNEEIQIESERQKREEARIKAEQRKRDDSNQQRKSKSNGSRWSSNQNTSAMSLSEIQDQEEKNRRAHEEKMRELQAKQRQIQSAASSGWSDKTTTSGGVKSLKAIQDEQARQPLKQNKQSSRTQPSQASPVWSNSWTAGNNNVWTGNDREEQQEPGFWDDVMEASNANQPLTQKTKKQQPKQQQNTTTTTKPVTNGRKSGKKTSKEEESVRRIFQQTTSTDPFTQWCTQSLYGLATAVDVPTFIAFLKELESPYEVHTYVREYIGDSNEAKTFAKEFIERHQSSEWKHVPSKSTTTAKQTSNVVARGAGGAPRNEPEGKAKKKKKQRMQKVDPSILGFSVNAAAERVNTGEIQSVDDSR